MSLRSMSIVFLACVLALCVTGCKDAPGMPKPWSEIQRPDQVLDFATLYGQNCAACHGDHGTNGAAISLANPVYLAAAGVEDGVEDRYCWRGAGEGGAIGVGIYLPRQVFYRK